MVRLFRYSYMDGLSLSMLKSYNESILSQLSSIENVHLKWLKDFIKILVSLFIIVLIYHIIVDGILNKRYRWDAELYHQAVLALLNHHVLANYWWLQTSPDFA